MTTKRIGLAFIIIAIAGTFLYPAGSATDSGTAAYFNQSANAGAGYYYEANDWASVIADASGGDTIKVVRSFSLALNETNVVSVAVRLTSDSNGTAGSPYPLITYTGDSIDEYLYYLKPGSSMDSVRFTASPTGKGRAFYQEGNTTVSNVHVTSLYTLSAVYGEGASLVDSSASNCYRVAPFKNGTSPSSYVVISGNSFYDTTGDFLFMTAASDMKKVRIENNVIAGGASGTRIYWGWGQISADGYVISNTFRGFQYANGAGDGAFFYQGPIAFIGNVFENNTNTLLWVDNGNASGTTFTNNTFRYHKGDIFRNYQNALTGLTFFGNTITSNSSASASMPLFDIRPEGVTVEGNYIAGNHAGSTAHCVFYFPKSSSGGHARNNVIRSNECVNNATPAFRIMGDLGNGNGTNNTVAYNVFSNNTADQSVCIQTGASNTLVSNTFKNQDFFLYLEYDIGSTLTGNRFLKSTAAGGK